MEYVIQFVVAGVVMAVIDAVWLSVVAKKFYESQIGSLLRDKPNFVAAVLFYVIYVAGIVAFALAPALSAGQWVHALVFGGLFGFVAYATYDLTNLSTIKGFTTRVVIVDMVWGTILTAAVTGISYWILH